MPLPGHTQTVTVNLLYYIGSGKCITILKMHDAHENKGDIVAYSTGSLALVTGLKCQSSFHIYLLLIKLPWACEHSGYVTGFRAQDSADAPNQGEKILPVKWRETFWLSSRLRSLHIPVSLLQELGKLYILKACIKKEFLFQFYLPQQYQLKFLWFYGQLLEKPTCSSML